jgi:alpha-D-xyloside xylohydrolase
LFDDEASDVLRHFVHIKNELMPYIYNEAVKAHKTGVPVMRPMMFDFMDDPACHVLDTQYMLGESLLAAPVFDENGDVCYYIPEGRWTVYMSGEVIEGGKYVRENHDYFSLPLLVRPNTVLVTGAHRNRPDYDYADGMTVRLYELSDGNHTTTVPDENGNTAVTITVHKTGNNIKVSIDSGKPWRIYLNNRIIECTGREMEVTI